MKPTTSDASVPSFSLVVAMDANRGIGRQGQLPWKLPADLKHFKSITTRPPGPGRQNSVIMGRKTWESIPSAFRPLPGRYNCVLSRNADFPVPEGVGRAASLQDALAWAAAPGRDSGDIFVIGGAEVYRQALELPGCRRIFLTRLQAAFDCDAFFPDIPPDFVLRHQSPPQEDQGIGFVFEELQRS